MNNIKKCNRKPLAARAIRNVGNCAEILKFLEGRGFEEEMHPYGWKTGVIIVVSAKGKIKADMGDWIVKYENGMIEILSDTMFNSMFEQ